MNKVIKTSFVLIAFCSIMLFTGCNSEGAFNSKPQTIDSTLISITVTPSPALVLEARTDQLVAGSTQQLVATAKFDDGDKIDISDSATWSIIGDPTIADVSASGLLTGNVKGATELIATKDGITSNTVNVNVCDLAGPCIDIFDTGNGKLFTNSPSVAYLDRIGGSATNGIYTENETFGPAGDYYIFDWDNANTLCTVYSSQNIGGRDNWRLATNNEIDVEVRQEFGDMFLVRGWPTGSFYHFVLEPNDPMCSDPEAIDYGCIPTNYPRNFGAYTSCVSEP